MGRLIGLALVYLVAAGLFGWWPFDDSAIQTVTGQCTHDAGYRDGWDGAAVACESTEYLAGYDEGSWQSDCHYAKCVMRDREMFKDYQCRSWDAMSC